MIANAKAPQVTQHTPDEMTRRIANLILDGRERTQGDICVGLGISLQGDVKDINKYLRVMVKRRNLIRDRLDGEWLYKTVVAV